MMRRQVADCEIVSAAFAFFRRATMHRITLDGGLLLGLDRNHGAQPSGANRGGCALHPTGAGKRGIGCARG